MGARVIVIDDNAAVRESLGDILRTGGYDVRIAEHGSEGLDLQREAPADVVISDMCMPQKSGIDTIAEIKREFPDARVIAISGGPGSVAQTGFEVYEQMLDAAREVGAHLTLTKPIRAQELLDAVDSLLNSQ